MPKAKSHLVVVRAKVDNIILDILNGRVDFLKFHYLRRIVICAVSRGIHIIFLRKTVVRARDLSVHLAKTAAIFLGSLSAVICDSTICCCSIGKAGYYRSCVGLQG